MDKIWNIDSVATPFASSIGSNSAHSTTHEWLEDTLAAAAFQCVPQGSNAEDLSEHIGTKRQNFTQIFRGVVTVSDTEQAVTNYGMKKMASYLAAKRTKEIKRDIEFTFLNDQTGDVGAIDTTPSTNTDNSGICALMTSAQGMIAAGNVTDNGGTTAFTEAQLLTSMQQCFEAGSNPGMVLVDPATANTIAAFATAGNGISRQLVNDTVQLTATVDVIRTPFGTLQVAIDRFTKSGANATDVFVLDLEYWQKSILRPSALKPLAVTGSSVRLMVETELTLQGSAFSSSAVITDIKTT